MTTSYSDALIFQNTEKEQHQRIALVITNILLITGGLISFAILSIAIITKSWHIFVLYGGNLLFLALNYLGLKQIKQNHITTGAIITSGSIQLTIALLPLLFTDVGSLVGLFSILTASLIIHQTVDLKNFRKIIPYNIIIGLLTILLIYLPTSFRIAIPTILIITIAIIAVFEIMILIVVMWLQFKTFTIQTKLIVAFISLLVISLITTGGYNITTNYRIQRAQISTNLESETNAKSAAIVDFLIAARQDAVFLGQAEVLQNYIKTLGDISNPNIVIRARTVVEREFRRFAENREVYEQVRFLDNDGNEVIRIDTTQDGVSSIVPQSELRKSETLNVMGELNYFKQSNILSSGEIFESPLKLNIDNNNQIIFPYEPIIQYGTPLVINTQTKGVILINVYAENFLKILSASGSNTFLVDTNGYYLFHPDETKRWGRDLKTGITIGQDFPDLVNDLYSGKPGNREVNGYLITYAPIIMPGEDAPRWYIGTFVDLDSISRPIFTSTFNSLTLLLLTMGISIFMMTYLSSSITTPLGNLSTAARNITAGNLSARVNVETQDEIGALAEAFNIMSSQLQELVASLESRVSERTAELETEKQQSDARAKQFEAVTKVAGAISATKNLPELLPQITKVISEQFGFYHVGIFLNDPANQIAILRAANSEGGKKMIQRNHQLKIGEQGIVGHVAKTGKPRIALDVGEDANYFDNPELPSTHSEMALPLKVENRVIGALDIQSTEIGAFTDEDFETLSALADQVSLAIQNARLFDQIKNTLSESEAIQRQYIRETWEHLPKEEKISGFRSSNAGAVLLNEEAIDASDKREISVPIILRGETIGTLSVLVPASQRENTDQDDLIKAVADRIALSAENARLFEETTRRATREHLVSDITTKIRSTNDPQEMINTAMQELRRALGATRVEIVPQKIAPPPDK